MCVEVIVCNISVVSLRHNVVAELEALLYSHKAFSVLIIVNDVLC